MSKAYLFPGYGSQFVGMGKEMYESNPRVRRMYDRADEFLGYKISEISFNGPDEDLNKAEIALVAIFLHSLAGVLSMGNKFRPDMVAGHSSGEFAALTASGCVDFEDGLYLIVGTAKEHQLCGDKTPGAMAVIIGLNHEEVGKVCSEIEGIVAPAAYNAPDVVMISGERWPVKSACIAMKKAGAKKALVLPYACAYHSPLMAPAYDSLSVGINNATFRTPVCPVYQNADSKPHTDPEEIKTQLLAELTSPINWTRIVENMISDGMDEFEECGPGKVLTGFVKHIQKSLIK